MKLRQKTLFGIFLMISQAPLVHAQVDTSLTAAGELPEAVSAVGGIVLDIVGNNDTRIVSQVAASTLYKGFFGGNPGIIGEQTGFDFDFESTLGGGISEVAVRLTVQDGDTAASEFDYSQNYLLLNGIEMQNFSEVTTYRTDPLGLTMIESELGFGNETLNTGFFYNNETSFLNSFYTSLVDTEKVMFQLYDVDPGDNYFDFTLGVDASLIDVGTGPVVSEPLTPPVPEPATVGLLSLVGLCGMIGFRKRKTCKK